MLLYKHKIHLYIHTHKLARILYIYVNKIQNLARDIFLRSHCIRHGTISDCALVQFC